MVAHRKDAAFKSEVPHPGTFVSEFLERTGMHVGKLAEEANVNIDKLREIRDRRALPTEGEAGRLSVAMGQGKRSLYKKTIEYKEANG